MIRRPHLPALTALLAFCACDVLSQETQVPVVEDVVEIEAEEAFEAVIPLDDNQFKLLNYAKVEVALVRRACKLSEEQQQELAGVDEKWVKNICQEQVKGAKANVQQPGLIAMFFGARPRQNNAQQPVSIPAVKAKIDARLVDFLTEEQKAAYEKEKELRHQFRNEATADAFIESLQPRLGMTEQQREEIKARVVPWASRQDLHTMYYFSGNNYYPDLPEHLLSPTLDKEQMAAFRGLQKHLFTRDNVNDGNPPIVVKQ